MTEKKNTMASIVKIQEEILALSETDYRQLKTVA